VVGGEIENDLSKIMQSIKCMESEKGCDNKQNELHSQKVEAKINIKKTKTTGNLTRNE